MRPVIIDTDPGIDDALALLLAWGSPEIDVEALTTVAGNVAVDVATRNVFRLLALRQPSRVPAIAVGAAAPIARPLRTATRYHGEDGLGDLPDWPPVTGTPATMGATGLIVGAARRHGPRLTMVALGPLTNVALALAVEGGALSQIGRLVVMGGAVDVPGNVTPTAEFNMHVDPEAAARVFAAGLPIDLVPLDATRQAVLPRGRLEAALARRPGRLAERVAAFTRRGFRVDAERGTSGMILHDPLAVAVAVLSGPSDAETARGETRGCSAREVVEWETARLVVGPDGETRRAGGAPNCRFAVRVDVERFLDAFLDRLCPLSAP